MVLVLGGIEKVHSGQLTANRGREKKTPNAEDETQRSQRNKRRRQDAGGNGTILRLLPGMGDIVPARGRQAPNAQCRVPWSYGQNCYKTFWASRANVSSSLFLQ